MGRVALSGMALFLLTVLGIWLLARGFPLPRELSNEALFSPGPDGAPSAAGFADPSTVVTYRGGSPAHVFLTSDDKLRIEVRDLGEIDPKYLEALLAFEDRRFYQHGGVDLLAVARAGLTNLLAGEVLSGASTLTMQLVRMRIPRPRTFRAKLIEAFHALQLESRLEKDAILRAYLTHVPMGGNREGVEVAARAFFGHGAKHLSPEEIAVLLAVPQRPTPRSPGPRNRVRLEAARDHVLVALRGAGLFADAKTPGPVPTRIHPLPREIPHLAYALRARFPERRRFETTLDREVQRTVDALLEGARPGLEARGIFNGAVVVADHAKGEIRALAGSLDFFTDAHGGQIAGFSVPRSPGSALKPFLYGRAIEDGQILPGTLLADVPRAYPGYRPENYDGRFEGVVRAKEALARSLNLPFVDLLARIGVERFIGELVSLGATSIDDRPGRHGLSAAIGAVELTPLELAQLYAGIAADGQVRPLVLLKDGPRSAPLRMWSPGTAFLVRDALDGRDRPDFPTRSRFRGVPPGVHWKTGTSFLHRDAWAAGSDAKRTVVVWLGNFDRAPSPHLVGADAAAPLFFDLIEGLPGRAPLTSEAPPADLTEIEVCALSGRPAGDACPRRTRALALAHRVPLEICDIHTYAFVDRESGLGVDPACSGVRAERQVFEAWPSEVLRHLGPSARRLPSPPARDPRCRITRSPRPPQIASPSAEIRLLLPGVEPKAQELPFEARGAGRLSWFMDGAYLGSTEPGERLWWTPRAGRHEVVVMDEAGQTSRRILRVMDR